MVSMIIVDDEHIILESLMTLIDWKSIGVDVIGSADNGEAAVDMVIKLKPDIILSDISMPYATGLEMLETIRRNNIKSEVIFITAYGKFEYAREAIRHGAFDYILKPIDEKLLLAAVSRCAARIRCGPGGQETADKMQADESISSNINNERIHSSVRLVRQCIRIIHEQYSTDISLSSVAQQLYISSNYLSKIFSAETGKSFSRYLLEYRIGIAKKLLCQTNDKVYEIAYHVGYPDVVHFTKVFKQVAGVSPNRFRNQESPVFNE